ncbi:hypothetical protein HZB00_03045 [Candidatus Woesearchaeota archaeon]|nr:hypothetical protein [Candidatus Woesearchaeota archaeon]
MLLILETMQEIEQGIITNLLDESVSIQALDKAKKRQIKNLILFLELLVEEEADNPLLEHAVISAKEVIPLLQKIESYGKWEKKWQAVIERLPEKTTKQVNGQLEHVLIQLGAWIDHVKQLSSQVSHGNKHLQELPMHKNQERFYIFAKELVFGENVISKHPLTEVQREIQKRRSTKDLLQFDEKDPIKARRVFRKEDTGEAPASQIYILEGHHRLFELSRRYFQGRIASDTLIEALKD